MADKKALIGKILDAIELLEKAASDAAAGGVFRAREWMMISFYMRIGVAAIRAALASSPAGAAALDARRAKARPTK